MFVSSYSTYIGANSTQRIDNEKNETLKTKTSSFDKTLDSAKTVKSTLSLQNQFPVNYVSNYKALNNQQRLQQERTQEQTKAKFTQISTLQNAKAAYSENSQMFSLFLKPKVTLSQTPKLSTKLPKDAQIGQEMTLRHTMINTYIANENYYKITA